MKRCKLIPKSGEGAVWYCRAKEMFKKYATAYSLDGFETKVRMDRYRIEDATFDKRVAKMLATKPL
jgi:hypothetical protein